MRNIQSLSCTYVLDNHYTIDSRQPSGRMFESSVDVKSDMKFAIVNDDVKNKYKFNRDKRVGNGHIHILSFLKKEWDDGKVSPELVYRITDMIHQIHIEDYEYPEK